MEWTPTGTGHELTIRDGAIVARNDKGRELKTVPAKAKKTDVYEDLDALLVFLADHDAEAGAQVETWLLRSEPVTGALLAAVWEDEAWRSWLTDLVVTDDDGTCGFLRAATPEGLGVVGLDGESATLTAPSVRLAHPALLDDLDELREFAVEMGVEQRFDQLFREVNRRPDPAPEETVTSLDDWEGGVFEQLRFATSRATSNGFRVSGGFATTTIVEDGRTWTASYWIGAEDPSYETQTGSLQWTCDNETVPVAKVGPVAYSEGVRMARLIYASRKVDQQ